ncbi:MAG: FitA-like ribbon-helix-helix domain-containing protein [Bacillota bacterium]
MPHLQIRNLPEHLYRRIVALAEAERRSIAQEAIVLLERGLQLSPQLAKPRHQLLAHLLQETRTGKTADLPDPVKLIREDRER